MVTLNSKNTKTGTFEKFVQKVVKILDGNPSKKSAKKWSSNVEVIDPKCHICANHPDGYALVFQLKLEQDTFSSKIEIKPKTTFNQKPIWERLARAEKEALHPSLKLIVAVNISPEKVARDIIGKILANYIKYFDLAKERILEEEKKTEEIRGHIQECCQIIEGHYLGDGFSGHTSQGYFVTGTPAEKKGHITLRLEDIKPEKAKEIMKVLIS